MEVRCCCVPKKLLGWVDIKHKGSNTIMWPPAFSIDEAGEPRCIELEVALFNPGDGTEPYHALKSGELPIETLRLIPGFKENV